MIAMILDSTLLFMTFHDYVCCFSVLSRKVTKINRSRSDFQPSSAYHASALCGHFQCHHQPQDIATHWCINSSSLGESGCSTQGKAKHTKNGQATGVEDQKKINKRIKKNYSQGIKKKLLRGSKKIIHVDRNAFVWKGSKNCLTHRIKKKY